MSKKHIVRFIIAGVAYIAALVVLGFSTGLFPYWAKGINHYIDAGYKNNVSILVEGENGFSVSANAPAETSFGTVSLRLSETETGGTEVILEFSCKRSFGGANVMSAKPLTGKKAYLASVYVDNKPLAFSSQTVEKDKVVATYSFEGAVGIDAVFTVYDVVLNDFSR